MPLTAKQTKFVEMIADGQTMRQVAAELGCSIGLLCKWLAAEGADELRDRYARAREAQGDDSADKVAEISEDVRAGRLDPNAGRVAIDAHKWIAGKRRPKIYGERVQVAGDAANPLAVTGNLQLNVNFIDPALKRKTDDAA